VLYPVLFRIHPKTKHAIIVVPDADYLKVEAPSFSQALRRAQKETVAAFNAAKSRGERINRPSSVTTVKKKSNYRAWSIGHVEIPCARKMFDRLFCGVTASLRAGAGLTSEDMAGKLGLSERTYKRYERLKPLPHSLIAKFCAIVGVSNDDMFRMVATQATTLASATRGAQVQARPKRRPRLQR
jgi:DNA-binding XRE family transcriptional regulator